MSKFTSEIHMSNFLNPSFPLVFLFFKKKNSLAWKKKLETFVILTIIILLERINLGVKKEILF